MLSGVGPFLRNHGGGLQILKKIYSCRNSQNFSQYEFSGAGGGEGMLADLKITVDGKNCHKREGSAKT